MLQPTKKLVDHISYLSPYSRLINKKILSQEVEKV